MASSADLKILSLPTVTDFSQLQYTAVSVDTNGNAVPAVAAKNCIGFLQNAPNGSTDVNAAVAISGKTKAAITDTILIGAPLEIASGGTLVNHDTGTVVAFALDAGVTGNVIGVLFAANNGLLS